MVGKSFYVNIKCKMRPGVSGGGIKKSIEININTIICNANLVKMDRHLKIMKVYIIRSN